MRQRHDATVAAQTAASAIAEEAAARLAARPRVIRRAFQSSRRLFVAVTLGVCVIGLYQFHRWLKTAPLWQWQQNLFDVHTALDDSTAPDALVVLGYCVDHRTQKPTEPLLARLQLAVNIACESALKQQQKPSSIEASSSGSSGVDTLLRAVIFTGGSAPRTPLGLASEAEVMSASFSALWSASRCASLPEPRHILERASTSTFENARYTLAKLLRDEPSIRHLRLVTNGFHQWRSLTVFQRVEMRRQEEIAAARSRREEASRSGGDSTRAVEVTMDESAFSFSVAPMPQEESLQVPQFDFWREIAAVLYYACRGYL